MKKLLLGIIAIASLQNVVAQKVGNCLKYCGMAKQEAYNA